MRMLRTLCARWASRTDANAEHTCQELKCALSIRIRNWCMHWAYRSGTGVCTEHMPNGTRWGSLPFQGPKKSRFQGPPLQTALVMDFPHPNPYVPPHIKTGTLIVKKFTLFLCIVYMPCSLTLLYSTFRAYQAIAPSFKAIRIWIRKHLQAIVKPLQF